MGEELDGTWFQLDERDVIKRARMDEGLSREAVARAIDRTYNWLAIVESGRSTISDMDIGKLRGVLPAAHAELSRRRLEQYRRELAMDAGATEEAEEHVEDVARLLRGKRLVRDLEAIQRRATYWVETLREATGQ